MKKFIVTFSYNGFSFNAKVFISRQGNTIVYSTKLIEDCLSYMFNNKELVFTKEGDGYKMSLFTGATRTMGQTFTSLDWHIKNEYVDPVDSLHEKTFSMS